MQDRKNKPSIFLGLLAGYAIATAIGALFVIGVAINAGRASAAGGLNILLGAGALGALAGYLVTVKRREAQGIKGRYDDWSGFIGSRVFVIIAFIILLGSFGIAVLIKVVFDAIAGQPQ